MEKPKTEDQVEESAAPAELTAEEQEFLKKVEAGQIEEVPQEDSKPIDVKYSYYSSLKYDIDSDVGLIYKDYDLISKQRRMAFNLIRQIGGNILRGQSIMNVSFPVYIFEACSLLERFATQYSYVPPLLEPAAALKDPIEKMKAVMTWAVATMHLGIGQRKPFNPILGETLQGKLGDVEVYAEQIEHHPPISSLVLVGKGVKIYATHNVVANTYPNSAKATTRGTRIIEFIGAYPAKISVTHPQAEITGLMFGKRTFNYVGDIIFKDEANKLYGVIRVNPCKRGFFSSIFTRKVHRDDHIKGFITRDKSLVSKPDDSEFDEKGHLAYCEGYWIDKLTFDGKTVWEIDGVRAATFTRPGNRLLSDASLRPDVQALQRGDEKESQRLKELLENVQRNDRKLRGDAGKHNKK